VSRSEDRVNDYCWIGANSIIWQSAAPTTDETPQFVPDHQRRRSCEGARYVGRKQEPRSCGISDATRLLLGEAMHQRRPLRRSLLRWTASISLAGAGASEESGAHAQPAKVVEAAS
jgi:hypothetical protein